MASQGRPSLSRAPISYPPNISTQNLGQQQVKLQCPQSRSPVAAPLAMALPPRSNTSISSGLLTPPSVDSSPRARHPLADSLEYFIDLNASSPQGRVVTTEQSPSKGTPRPTSPLAGFNIVANPEESLLSSAERIISALSKPPRQIVSREGISQPRKDSLSKIDTSESKEKITGRRVDRVRERQKSLNSHFQAAQEPWNRKTWRIPRCQMAPTAPNGYKELCTRRVSLDIPGLNLVLSNRDTEGSLIQGVGVQGSSKFTSRRWSSVELGTHRVLDASVHRLPASRHPSPFEPKPRRRRDARTMTTSAIVGEEIAQLIRRRLMYRQLAEHIPQVPSSITLERASSESKSTTDSSPVQRSPEYVITGADINSITEIIKSTLQQGSLTHANSSSQPSFGSSSVSKTSNVMSFEHYGLVPMAGIPIDTTVTPAKAYRVSERLMDAAKDFRFPPKSRKSSRTQEVLRQSRHEVIWTAMSSERQVESFFKLQLTERCTSPQGEELQTLPISFAQPTSAFDPKNAIASINQWSWDLPTNKSSENANWSTMASPTRSPEAARRPGIRRCYSYRNEHQRHKYPHKLRSLKSHRSDSNVSSGYVIENVVSFPPLPRKLTCDWILPLPVMECTPPSTEARMSSTSTDNTNHSARTRSVTRYLYDQVIDATIHAGGLDSRVPRTTTSPCSTTLVSLYDKGIDATVTEAYILTRDKTPTIRMAPHPPKGRPASPKVIFDPQYEVRRNKSVAQIQVVARPRTGDQASIGSSIGSSSGRKKSTHVALQDSRYKASSKSTKWSKVRADSAYPRPMSEPSDASTVDGDRGEDGDDYGKNDGIVTPRPNREAFLLNQYPSLPTRDRVGIYDAMTGVRTIGAQEQVCIESGCEQPGHDACGHSRNPSVDWIG